MGNQSNFGVRQQSFRDVDSSTNQNISNHFVKNISNAPLGLLANLLSSFTTAFTFIKEIASRTVVVCKRFYHARHLPEDAKQLLTQMRSSDTQNKAAKNLGCALENKWLDLNGNTQYNEPILASINHAKEILDDEWQSIETPQNIRDLLKGTQILKDLDGRTNLKLSVDGRTIAITNATGNTEGQPVETEQYARGNNLKCLIDNVDTIAKRTGISKENIWRAIFMVPGQSLAGSFNKLFQAGIEGDGYTTNIGKSQSTLTLSFNPNGTIQACYETIEPIRHAHIDGEECGFAKSVSDQLQMAVIETAVLTLNTKDDNLEYKPAYGESKMSFHAADIDEKGNIKTLHQTPLLEIEAKPTGQPANKHNLIRRLFKKK